MTDKNRSYTVRDEIAKALGKPLHCDFSCNIPVRLRDGRRVHLLSTSNAGFRGIEGFCQAADGTRFSISLGEIAYC